MNPQGPQGPQGPITAQFMWDSRVTFAESQSKAIPFLSSFLSLQSLFHPVVLPCVFKTMQILLGVLNEIIQGSLAGLDIFSIFQALHLQDSTLSSSSIFQSFNPYGGPLPCGDVVCHYFQLVLACGWLMKASARSS